MVMFLLYPCEECGFRGGDMRELASHMDQGHESETECSMESLGISQLPVYTKRRKQNFSELSIDDNGDINVEEEDSDPEFTMDDDNDDEESVIESEPSSQSVKRKITHIVTPPTKRRKIAAKKKTKHICDVCKLAFVQKNSLTRHMKNKH